MANLPISQLELNALLVKTDPFGDLGFDLLDSELDIDPILRASQEKAPSLKVGDKFNNLQAFKDALLDQAIYERWEVRCVKSSTSHVRYTCFFPNNCQWRARCNWSPKAEEATITVWNGEHTCFDQVRYQRPAVARIEYLLELVPKLLTVERKTHISSIRDQILRHTEIVVQDQLLYRLKRLLTEDSKTQQINDFPKLPIYLYRLQEANRHRGQGPDEEAYDLKTELLLSADNVFRRVFVGPHTSRSQYVHSIPFIALDGTYLRNCFKQTLLLAVGRNGNNESWIMAWAIVESENDDSWSWFVERLVQTIPKLADALTYGSQTPCVISDRNSSLLKAILTFLPDVTDVYCCWHLLENVLNVTKHANKKAIKEAWWMFPFAKNEAEWNRAVRKMREFGGQEAVDYIEGLDKSKFCVWKLPGVRYGHSSSGVVEGQNGHIRELREMGIMELLDALWNRSSRKRQLTYEAAKRWMEARDRYTPFARKKIMANTLWSRRGAQTALITAHTGRDKVLEARIRCQYDGIGERIHIVRCQEFWCSCGQFQEWRLPCSHAITATRYAKRDVWEWVAPFWEPFYVGVSTAYLNDLDAEGNYVNNHMRTIKIDDIKPEFFDDECKAPQPKLNKAGPNQKKRKEVGDAPEKVVEPWSCSRCGRIGHNRRNKECPAYRA